MDWRDAELTKLRKALRQLTAYAATVEDDNTREWMEGLLPHLHYACEALGDTTVFEIHHTSAIHACTERTWIEKGRSKSC